MVRVCADMAARGVVDMKGMEESNAFICLSWRIFVLVASVFLFAFVVLENNYAFVDRYLHGWSTKEPMLREFVQLQRKKKP